MTDSINNCGITRETLQTVKTQDVAVFTAREGRAFAHHSFACRFRGRYYVMWSSGVRNEDDVGQSVMIARSEDFFSWDILTELKAEEKNAVLTSCGFYVRDDALVAYAGSFCYKSEALADARRNFAAGDRGHKNTRLYAFVSADGVHFGKAQPLGLKVVPNFPPKELDGKLFMCGNYTISVSEQKDGLHGFCLHSVYGGGQDCTDDSEAFHAAADEAKMPSHVCECDLIERDGRYTALFRNQNGGVANVLYASESEDGVRWEKPVPTMFSNYTSKFSVGRLPDGRYYYVGNPLRGNREPLVLSLSENGTDFTRHYLLREGDPPLRFAGFAKSGRFAYPCTFADEKYLYVSYTQNKEDVHLLRLELCAIL